MNRLDRYNSFAKLSRRQRPLSELQSRIEIHIAGVIWTSIMTFTHCPP